MRIEKKIFQSSIIGKFEFFNFFNITRKMSAIPWCQNNCEKMAMFLLRNEHTVTLSRQSYSEPVGPAHFQFFLIFHNGKMPWSLQCRLGFNTTEHNDKQNSFEKTLICTVQRVSHASVKSVREILNRKKQ